MRPTVRSVRTPLGNKTQPWNVLELESQTCRKLRRCSGTSAESYLTNGWDRHSRREAATKFHLDWEEFQDRHDFSFPAFDSGHITLNEYLDRTLFYRPRPFTREEFVGFMFAQSKEYPDVRAVLDQTTQSGKYLISSINNEPLELNQYRIETFDLRRNFVAFFSSCYVRARKPDETIFRMALEVTQRSPAQCIFIDDRSAEPGESPAIGHERDSPPERAAIAR